MLLNDSYCTINSTRRRVGFDSPQASGKRNPWCMYIHTSLYILYVFLRMGYFGMLWEGVGTDVSVYSFCILYVLLFDDFQQ